jgi:hypothetical protein
LHLALLRTYCHAYTTLDAEQSTKAAVGFSFKSIMGIGVGGI